ncbi:O-antigen ligase family protein [uncultured Microbulbifer sp.]|uniref:O-antigen ligase family protein n=1 Tax=uncultured Microbulbifer sp. TaxID=348147 RepID=UPI0025E45866|nr:O-antigen ligase family protein [uncultured Microbulbifer sp.]
MTSTPSQTSTNSAGLLSAGTALPLWQNNCLMRPKPWLQVAGALALLVYAFFGIALDSLPEKAALLANLFGLAMLAFYGGPVHGVSLRKSTIVWLAVAAIGVAFISWVASWILHPQWAESSFKVHRLTTWFAMIPVAAILGGRERNAHLLWAVALVGLLLSPWIAGGGFAEWQRGLSGERIDFNLLNAQHTAMLFGTAALGLLAFAPRLLTAPRCSWLCRGLWLLALATCIAAIITTQTRGVWAGFVVALAVLAIAAVVALRQRFKAQRKLIASSAIAACLCALALGYFTLGDIVNKRLAVEHETLQLVQQGDLDKVPYTSAGIRLHTWEVALQWIGERPLVGWGGNGRSLIFDHSTRLPEDIKQRFGHLHNSYLDLLVNFGLLGLALLAALVYWLVSRCLRYYRAGLLPGSSLVFCLSFATFFGVINLFESYLFYDSGRLVLAIVGGGLLTQLWAAKRAAASAPGEAPRP